MNVKRRRRLSKEADVWSFVIVAGESCDETINGSRRLMERVSVTWSRLLTSCCLIFWAQPFFHESGAFLYVACSRRKRWKRWSVHLKWGWCSQPLSYSDSGSCADVGRNRSGSGWPLLTKPLLYISSLYSTNSLLEANLLANFNVQNSFITLFFCQQVHKFVTIESHSHHYVQHSKRFLSFFFKAIICNIVGCGHIIASKLTASGRFF